METIIGIDLGTTNSCVAILEAGEPTVISNEEGSRVTPSIVAFTEDGSRLVGHIAKRQARTNPENTFYAVKRFIGKKFEDPQVQKARKNIPYKITEADNGDVKFSARDKEYTAQEISAMILKELKSSVERYLDKEVNQAVITVPAYFDDAQRQATKDAGKIAGLDVKRIVNEPTAASLAYERGFEAEKNIAVYDLGGGTFDISILTVSEGVCEVISTSGDTFLGGEDFDREIVDYLAETFEEEHGVDLRNDKMALQRLNEEAEKAKRELSSAQKVDFNLPFIYSDEEGSSCHLKTTMTREEFEERITFLVDRTEDPCYDALEEAGMEPGDISEVILVGGQTRAPVIRSKVEDIFNQEPRMDVNPDEVVAKGAATQAGIIQGEIKDVVLLDVTPLSLGIEAKGGTFVKLIERNSSIPTKKSRVFTTVTDNQSSVEIHVLQGESELASRNRSLGEFELENIPPAPRGVPEIKVTFKIDSNGIVNVSAYDKATERSKSISVTPASGLSEEEIEEIIEEAEKVSEEEERKVELIKMQNRLEDLYLQNKKSYEEFGDLLQREDRQKVERALKEAERALKKEDMSRTNDAFDSLKNVSETLAEVVL